MSAITPPELTKGELPKAPAKNRKTAIEVMFLDAHVAAFRAVSAAYYKTS